MVVVREKEEMHKLPTVEAIRYQGLPYNSLPDLWHALHLSYNAAANCSVQLSILDNVPCLAPQPWVFFFFSFCSKIYNMVLDYSLRQTIYNK